MARGPPGYLSRLLRWFQSLIWTSEKDSTEERGRFIGTRESLSKPPLHPKSGSGTNGSSRKRQQPQRVVYLDDGWWDARMRDVD